MNTIQKINNFLRNRVCDMGSFKEFRESQLFEHYANIFGELIYTEDTSIDFIGLGTDHKIYDEMYYPQDITKKGVIIPRIFYEANLTPCIPDLIWKDVAEKGYHVIKNIDVGSLKNDVLEEAYIPHGFNSESNMSKSIMHPYFFTLMDYDRPENHRSPEYMKKLTSRGMQYIPQGQPIVNSFALTTSDAVKYVFDPSDYSSIKGPYSFHMDYFNRLLYMFFMYFSQTTPIVGRELLVGKRDDFSDFFVEGMELSSPEQPKNPTAYEKVSDDKVQDPHVIKLEDNMLVVVNTFNPMFVHKVLKLREINEVVLITNYAWSKDRPKID